ncbi:type II toxin-antitoxin system mRNA interferase toxin, RelE/StbE family [Patescibacteria group bacterium]|nr:type II toxin-antitoxin system mRNA interferase toxin, RelE/StbE family [Patescibacteria group bacterium]
MPIRFDRQFRKQYNKAPGKIKQIVKIRLKLFRIDQFSPPLNNHVLKGKYSGLRSINITGDWRALYVAEGQFVKQIVFVALGTHSQLYR